MLFILRYFYLRINTDGDTAMLLMQAL